MDSITRVLTDPKGNGTEFCAVPAKCQPDFGYCDSKAVPSGYNTLNDARPNIGGVSYGQLITRCKVNGTIALTYDDGPTENTDELLDILNEAGVKATFFVTGIANGLGALDQTDARAKSIGRMSREGHQIASHTWSHFNLNNLSTYDRRAEMAKNEQALVNIIGKYPTYMRPPFLQCSVNGGCQRDMRDLGYHIVGYSTDSTDWMHEGDLNAMINATDAALNATDASGNMLLIQHDSIRFSAINLTQHILPQIAKKGWRGKCVSL
ncbi:hypothetical protein LTR84_008099 [Exophiala bonariae]|uniref:NodB homology domain-containing protein n=1 Tax=Exophiala bonariae TaxID=1690606 RepID=A0AAV9NMC4_9EURO|nr:hypothetical protein LTR84_008099 [Exophiala bonariae]